MLLCAAAAGRGEGCAGRDGLGCAVGDGLMGAAWGLPACDEGFGAEVRSLSPARGAGVGVTSVTVGLSGLPRLQVTVNTGPRGFTNV